MNVQAKAAVLATLTLAQGCGCDCLSPSGPRVDMTEARADVQAVFEGTFTGKALDDPGDGANGVTFVPCEIADEAFTVTLAVGEPSCTDADHPERADCSRADQAYFPLSGTIQVAEDAPIALDGGVEVWSGDDGLIVWSTNTDGFGGLGGPYTRQTLDFTLSDDVLLSDVALRGLSWAGRLSEEGAAEVVWEQCALAFE